MKRRGACLYCFAQNSQQNIPISTPEQGVSSRNDPQVGRTTGNYDSTNLETHEIVAFHDAASSSTYSRFAVPAPVHSAMDEYVHSIESYLKRPYLLSSGTLSPGSGAIFSGSVGNILIDPVVAGKVANFGMFRGDLHVKVTMNATPFTMGRFALVHTPYYQLKETTRRPILTSLPHITSFPYAEVDIASGESANLVIPYCGVAPVMDPDPTVVENVSWSDFHFVTLSGLQGSDTAVSADYSIYAWIENLHLSVPVPQAGDESEAVAAKSQIVINVPLPKKEPPTLPGWFSHLAAGAASFLGFSRPPNLNPNMPYSNLPARGFTHSADTDDSVSLSMFPSNAVRNDSEINGANQDEMKLSNFLRQYQIFSTVNWSTASTGVFYDQQLNPEQFLTTRFGALADIFGYYRGSISFRFSAVKTPFHSGRIAIEYVPFGAAAASYTPSQPSVVWDVRTNKDIQVHVPFVARTRYILATANNFGRIVLRVLNPLKASDGAPTSVPILVYISLGEDVSFAVPLSPTNTYTQAGENSIADIEPPPQANTPDSRLINIFPSVSPSSDVEATVVMGEPVLSLLSIVKRFVPMQNFTNIGITIDPMYMGLINSEHPIFALSHYFQFWRGSLRYKFILKRLPTDGSGNTPEDIVAYSRIDRAVTNSISPPTPGTGPFVSATSSPAHRTFPRINPVHEVSLPYYVQTDRVFTDSVTLFSATNRYTLDFWYEYDTTVYTNPPITEILLAGGDDFSFSFPGGTRTAT